MKPMKKIDTYIYKLGLWAGAALSLTACVDEDLSDCPPNVEMREITVSYQIDLQLTNIETNEVVWMGDKKIKKHITDRVF